MLSERDFRLLTLEVHLSSGDCKLVGLNNNVLLVIDLVGLNECDFRGSRFDTVGGIIYLLMQLPRKILHLQLQVGLPHLHP